MKERQLIKLVKKQFQLLIKENRPYWLYIQTWVNLTAMFAGVELQLNNEFE